MEIETVTGSDFYTTGGNFMGKFVRAFRQGGKDAGSLFTYHSFIRAEDKVNGMLL